MISLFNGKLRRKNGPAVASDLFNAVIPGHTASAVQRFFFPEFLIEHMAQRPVFPADGRYDDDLAAALPAFDIGNARVVLHGDRIRNPYCSHCNKKPYRSAANLQNTAGRAAQCFRTCAMRSTAITAIKNRKAELKVARPGKVGAAIMTKLLNRHRMIIAPAKRTSGKAAHTSRTRTARFTRRRKLLSSPRDFFVRK